MAVHVYVQVIPLRAHSIRIFDKKKNGLLAVISAYNGLILSGHFGKNNYSPFLPPSSDFLMDGSQININSPRLEIYVPDSELG